MRVIVLTVKGDRLVPSEPLAGQTGEHHATVLNIELPEYLQNCDEYSLWFCTADGLYYQTNPITVPIAYQIPSTLLYPGKLKVYLEAKTDQSIQRTGPAELTVNASPDWESTAETLPDHFDDLVDELRQEFADAIAKSNAVYETFVAGEFKGEPGEQGPAGPQGLPGAKGDPGESVEVVVLANKDAYDALPPASKQDAAKIYAWGY